VLVLGSTPKFTQIREKFAPSRPLTGEALRKRAEVKEKSDA
jgi:hypothetical protein